MSLVVLRFLRYLQSKWAKEAQNSREQGNEPDLAQLTKFVVKKAKLANMEYGHLINPKSEVEKGRAKKSRYFGPSNKASCFAINGSVSVGVEDPSPSGRPPDKRLPVKSYCCEKNGYTIERCFKFQQKS